MKTACFQVDPLAPDAGLIEQAATVIHAGGLVAFPTETVYGLGANALSRDAVRSIFVAKGRPGNNPVIVHIADLTTARSLTSVWPAEAETLARAFWPGPLTLVLPCHERVPLEVTGGGPTVGLRIPAHPVALALLRAGGVPIAAPSANRSTELSPTRAEHVYRALDGRIDMILDAGPTSGGLESTVVDLSVTPPRLLRPGLIAPAELEKYLGAIVRRVEVPAMGVLPAPGMMARHYAPRTPLLLVEDGQALVEQYTDRSERVAWLVQHERTSGHLVIRMPDRATDYGAQLYEVLHRLDSLGLSAIVVEMPPAHEEWLAVRDRLRRAAALG